MTTNADAARENARHSNGTFGEQQHSAPEQDLVTPDSYRSHRTNELTAKAASLKEDLDRVKDARRAQHLLDISRAVPANITRVVFRVDCDDNDSPDFLMFDHSMTDDGNDEELAAPLKGYLYDVGLDFGSPGEFVAEDWMDGEDEPEGGEQFRWIDLDEESALDNAAHFRAEMNAEREAGGLMSIQNLDARDAWTERAIRARAHQAGVTSVHLKFSDGGEFPLETVWLNHVDRGMIRPDNSDGDHMFIVGQVQTFTYRSAGMKPVTEPDAPLMLVV